MWLADGPHEVVGESYTLLEDGEPALGLPGPLVRFIKAVRVEGSGRRAAAGREVLVPAHAVLEVGSNLVPRD